MRRVAFYHKETGLLHSKSLLVSDDRAVLPNTPADHLAIDHPENAMLDHLSQRVDVSTGKVIDYQPPPPSDDHEWDAASRRWKLSASAQARETTRAAALAECRAIELSQEHASAVRDALLGRGSEALRKLDGQIAELRKCL